MKRLLLLLLACVFVAGCELGPVIPGPIKGAPPSCGQTIGQMEYEIANEINLARITNGVAPLLANEDLGTLSRWWSEQMLNVGFRHSSDLERYGFHGERALSVGENIAQTDNPCFTGTGFVVSWMNSEGHRRTLLDPNWTVLGVGIAFKWDGSIWATTHFSGLAGAIPPRYY